MNRAGALVSCRMRTCFNRTQKAPRQGQMQDENAPPLTNIQGLKNAEITRVSRHICISPTRTTILWTNL